MPLEIRGDGLRRRRNDIRTLEERAKPRLAHRPSTVVCLIVETGRCAFGAPGRALASGTADLLEMRQRTGEVVVVQAEDGGCSERLRERDHLRRETDEVIHVHDVGRRSREYSLRQPIKLLLMHEWLIETHAATDDPVELLFAP
jgi:hypothetical protein